MPPFTVISPAGTGTSLQSFTVTPPGLRFTVFGPGGSGVSLDPFVVTTITADVALLARVRILPSGSESGASVQTARAALVLRGEDTPNVLVVDRVTNAETGEFLALASLAWRLEQRVTRAVLAAGTCTLSAGTWRSVVRHPGGTGIVLVLDLAPSIGARTRLRFATSWIAR